MATLEQRVADLALRVSTQAKKLATQINGNLNDLSTLKTTAKSSLLAAINELFDNKMQRASYDSNSDGKVNSADTADAVPWGGVSGKPSEFPPANHDASKVTSGVFPLDRLPAGISNKPTVVANFAAISNLSAAQQAEIVEGSRVVITTTGKMYWYNGTGAKNNEANYTFVADATPEWNTIENRPTTTSGYAITDIGDTDRDFVAVFENGLN